MSDEGFETRGERRVHGAGSAARPAASAGLIKPMSTVRSVRQQQEAVNTLGHTPKLDVDGEWGPKTAAGVKWLQKKIGADVDGEWDAETERLFKARSEFDVRQETEELAEQADEVAEQARELADHVAGRDQDAEEGFATERES